MLLITPLLCYHHCLFQNEEKLREALKFSNACGAICTTKKGAIPALPTVATAQELIAKAT